MTIKQKAVSIVMHLLMIFVMGFGFVSPVQAQLTPDTDTKNELPQYTGVEGSLREYLCTPDMEGIANTILFDCIGKLYRFGIAFGSIALVFFLVVGGYMYMVGGESGKQNAKGVLVSALTGMAIMLSSYVLLAFINPDLTKFKAINPPVFNDPKLPQCTDIGYTARCTMEGGGTYIPPAGGGSPSPGGSANEQKYKPLIKKYADQRSIEYCALEALVRKESTFNPLAVSNSPPKTVDTSAAPPVYNISFEKVGHGIGLIQVYIYERTRGPANGWTNGVPARAGAGFGFSRPLYVKDLIDPEINMQAGSFLFANHIKQHKGNLKEAYRSYQGLASKEATLKAYLDMYNACKTKS